MKRFIVLVVALALLVPAAFAQRGDARAQGLAGAMTAVNDDMNSLFYNPAGLAYLRKSYFSVDTNVDIDFGMGLFSSNSLLDVYPNGGSYNNSTHNYDYTYVAYDSFTGTSSVFDFDEYYTNNAVFQSFAAQ